MNKSKSNSPLGNFYSPYSQTENDMSLYDKYAHDPDKFIQIGNLLFSKIIYRYEFYIYGSHTLLVCFEPCEILKIADILIDELGNTFTVRAFEMFRHTGFTSEYSDKICSIAITGDNYTIGNYLAKINSR